jgi:hypothetical protein
MSYGVDGLTVVIFGVYSLQQEHVWRAMDFHSGSTIPAFRHHITLLPPQSCSSQIAYWCIIVPSFLRFLLVTRFFLHDYLPTTSTAPSLRALILSNSLIRFQSIQVHRHHPKFLFSNSGGKTIPSGKCSNISGSYSTHDLFLCFGWGRSLYNVQFMFFHNPLDPLAACFTNSNPRVLLNSLLLHGCCLRPRFLISILCSSFD